MDRTTLGRNMLPLEREGLIEIVPGSSDRRTKELRLTEAGMARLRAASPGWNQAQSRFEEAFGRKRSSELRGLLREVVASEL
jgi:DNA-binding MarR family transcriptional regulator